MKYNEKMCLECQYLAFEGNNFRCPLCMKGHRVFSNGEKQAAGEEVHQNKVYRLDWNEASGYFDEADCGDYKS